MSLFVELDPKDLFEPLVTTQACGEEKTSLC